MRILVYGLVGTNLGGIETFLLNMNEHMSSACIFDYVVEEDTCIHLQRIQAKGGCVYHVASRHSHPVRNILDTVRLLRKLRHEYGAIYCNLSSLSWIIPEAVGRLLGYRVIVHSHNAMLIDKNSSLPYRAVNGLNKKILEHMKVTRLSCSALAATFLFGKRKATLIYNGIDVERYCFSKGIREEKRREYKLGKGLVVGCVGRLAYQKNPLFTLEIFCELIKEAPDAVLLMIGDGDLKAKLAQRVREKGLEHQVQLLGNISNVHELLQAMDVFLLPSRHEGLGIALIEAQAAGLPCVTSEGVVPEEAAVTRLLHFQSLSSGPDAWARQCMQSVQEQKEARESYYTVVKNSPFHLAREAKRLEHILSTE